MRRRRFSPSFDSLSLRITPSTTTLAASVSSGSQSTEIPFYTCTMPGERTTLTSWDLDGSSGPIDLDQPPADPSVWS
ncbi:hypothetical protein P12x_005168 [Tundrisphaera lichenicola]|uniref:hypothetical protein n=1 Tax=Tundrisphaera lichenicola TaxID=2029860 RepID=UPI003EBC97E7